jgi:hypothetical protein
MLRTWFYPSAAKRSEKFDKKIINNRKNRGDVRRLYAIFRVLRTGYAWAIGGSRRFEGASHEKEREGFCLLEDLDWVRENCLLRFKKQDEKAFHHDDPSLVIA